MCTTKLKPVRDWGWHRYVARYYRDQAHHDSGEAPLLEREFVESEAHAEHWVFGYEGEGEPEGGWPYRQYGEQAGYASYEVVAESVENTLRFVSGGARGGTEVVGSGWVTPLPSGWLGR